MSRQARHKGEFSTYHVMLRGNERREIFSSEEDRYKFLEVLGRVKEKYNISIYAYCLMGNHIHLMLNDNGNDISQVMKSLSISYVMYYNRKYQRTGHLFQDRFLSELILSDQYLLQASKYIHNNPVKAGLVTSPQEYRWSSYNVYLGAASDKLGLDRTKILTYLSANMGKAISQYRSFVSQEEVAPAKFLAWDNIKVENRTKNYIWTIGQAEERLKGLLQEQGKTKTELLGDRELRNQAIKLIRENSSLTLKEIGQMFGGISESRVSRILKG